jgi:hypothetical protein
MLARELILLFILILGSALCSREAVVRTIHNMLTAKLRREHIILNFLSSHNTVKIEVYQNM